MAATTSSRTIVAPITLKVGGTDLDPKFANRLIDVKVRQSLLAPDVADVRIMDPRTGDPSEDFSFIKSASYAIGKEIEILTGGPDASAPKRIFKGTIATLEPEFGEDSVIAAFRAYDQSRKLTRGRQTRTFKNMSVSDVMQTVLQGAGFQPDVSSTSVVHEWLQQTEESDWDFLWRLARSVDYVMIVEDKKAKLGPLSEMTTDVPFLEWGKGQSQHRLFSFLPTLSAAQVPEKVVAIAHDAKSHQEWIGEAPTFSETLLAESQASGKVKTDGSPIYTGTAYRLATTAANQSEINAKAKAIAARLLQTAAEATGVAEGRPDLIPGAKVEVKSIGPFAGKYIISEAIHTYRGGSGYRTQILCAGPAARSLGQLMGAGSNGHGSYGSQFVLGVVTNNNDPDKMGRVKVKFSTLRSQEGETESWWARIASPSTGPNRGVMMLPQVNEEVLIGFEHGDTARPFVLGSLWHGKALPGDDLVSKQDGSFVVRSDKQVNMKAQKEIVVEAGKDFTVTVGGKTKMKTTGDVEDETSGQRKIKTTGNTTIESTGNVTIKSSGQMQIEAATISVKGQGKLDLEAPMVNIKGSAAVIIDGGIIKLG